MSTQHALILYPRSYNKRGKEQHHSVLGVTTDGRLVNVKLRLDDKYRNHPSAPKISEFARDDIRAETPCIAAETNGPLTPEGILLFTDVVQEEADVYVARWAYVLAAHSKKPAPWIGFGRMEVIKTSQETQRLKAELAALNAQPGTPNPAEVARLQAAIDNPVNWAHIGVFFHPKATVAIKARDVNETSITQHLAYLINEYTRDGISGGVLYRIRRADGTIQHGKTHEWYARRRANESAFQRGEDLAKDIWSHSLSHQLAKLDAGSTVELMPLSRISCGPSGNKYYGEATRHQKLQDLYTQDGQTVSRAIVIRPQAYQTDPPSYLLGQIQHLDGEVGDAVLLTADGFTLRYHNDRLKPETFGITEEDLIEKPIGLWANGKCLKPANTRTAKPRRPPEPLQKPAPVPESLPEVAAEEAELLAHEAVMAQEEGATTAPEAHQAPAAPEAIEEAASSPVAALVPATPDTEGEAAAAVAEAAPETQQENPVAADEHTPVPAATIEVPVVALLNDEDHDQVVATVSVSADMPISLEDFGGQEEGEDEPMNAPHQDDRQATEDAATQTDDTDMFAPEEESPCTEPPEETVAPAAPLPKPEIPSPAAKNSMAAFLFGNN